jgi:hypothetical protein
VRAQTWATTEVKDLGALVGGDPMPSLVCGDHVVYAVVDGDEERTVRTMLGDDPSAKVVIDDEGFSDEDGERDFKAYSVGDDLGMVRTGERGTLALRELSKGKLGAWQKLAHKLGEHEDVELVDADASNVAIVYTNDESTSCADESVSESVYAIRVDRVRHKDAPPMKLAPAECGKDVGPFWIGWKSESLVVGWVEQGKRGDAPIRGFAYQVLTGGGANGLTQHVEQPADALVDAECDVTTCYAVALAREDGADGMAPEPAKLVRYP